MSGTATNEQTSQMVGSSGRQQQRGESHPAEMFFGIALMLTTLFAAYGILSFVISLFAG